MTDLFTADVVAQVARHMNTDHAEDSVLICQGLGNEPGTTIARMSSVDAAGMDFMATVDGAERLIRIPFRQPVTERRQIRAEAAWMYHESCARLGVPPRPAAS